MTIRTLSSILAVACVAASLVACGKGGANANRQAANGSASANQPANSANASDAAAPDFAKLDAEIMRLEADAASRPDDNSLREAVANAYAKRGAANYQMHKPAEALKDYQSALNYNPDNEEAQLRVQQIGQEIGGDVRTDDGKPVTVPAKTGALNSNK
jgi:tetratricopeptide (TPR) repeat protein